VRASGFRVRELIPRRVSFGWKMRVALSKRPVSWLAPIMGEGDDLYFSFRFPVYDSVGKTTQRQASHASFGRHARDGRAETRMALDQLQGTFNFNEEFSAESGLFLFVPRNNRAEFISSRVLDADGLAHLRRISALIWRRTSAQSVVPVVPASNAAHRRSISAAHAASTSAASPSRAASKLSINRAAISARSCSERPSASCRTLSAMAVIKRTIPPDAKLTNMSITERKETGTFS
jgi:hypothetical protein